ncbi:MAG: hypothetical protein HY043_00280, partial [Verrucomicrobia bacterium]|nr:hypothetical protein [Verrucomicrobiota bacterium]
MSQEDERQAKLRAEHTLWLSEELRKSAEEHERQAKLVREDVERELGRSAQEVERLAAEAEGEMHENQIELSENRNQECSYKITLGPGIVRYLEVAVFLEADVESWINLLRGLSPEPKIHYSDGHFIASTAARSSPGLDL